LSVATIDERSTLIDIASDATAAAAAATGRISVPATGQ